MSVQSAATTWLFRVNGLDDDDSRRALNPDLITPGADGKSVTATYTGRTVAAYLRAPSPFRSARPVQARSLRRFSSRIFQKVWPTSRCLSTLRTDVGDLTATLIAPDGTKAILFQNIGGSEDDFSGTIFDDTETTSITVAMHPFTGEIQAARKPLAIREIGAKRRLDAGSE